MMDRGTLQLQKNLLILSSFAPPMTVGGASSLYTLFVRFPSEKFAILTGYRLNEYQKRGVRLPCNYYFYNHKPIALLEQQQIPQSITPRHPLSAIIVRVIEMVTNVLYLLRPVKVVILWTTFYLTILRFLKRGSRVIDETQAEILIGVSDNGPAMFASYRLSQRFGLPLVYFLFDIYHGNNLDTPGDSFAKKNEEKMFTHAKQIIVTNEGTQLFYQKRYPHLHDRFSVIHNSVFVEEYPQTKIEYSPKPPFTILFTGNIYWAQEQSMMNLIKALGYLEDLQVELHIYTASRYGNWYTMAKNKKNIFIHDFVSRVEVARLQIEADVLFLPLAWNTKAPDIIATATPGKFTDYLASGRPMLVHAPHYAYVSQYTKEHGCGIVVDENNVDALATAIRNFLQHPETGKEYITRALDIFHKNHDARTNAAKLVGILNASS